jgi:hypothetical protein
MSWLRPGARERKIGLIERVADWIAWNVVVAGSDFTVVDWESAAGLPL